MIWRVAYNTCLFLTIANSSLQIELGPALSDAIYVQYTSGNPNGHICIQYSVSRFACVISSFVPHPCLHICFRVTAHGKRRRFLDFFIDVGDHMSQSPCLLLSLFLPRYHVIRTMDIQNHFFFQLAQHQVNSFIGAAKTSQGDWVTTERKKRHYTETTV